MISWASSSERCQVVAVRVVVVEESKNFASCSLDQDVTSSQLNHLQSATYLPPFHPYNDALNFYQNTDTISALLVSSRRFLLFLSIGSLLLISRNRLATDTLSRQQRLAHKLVEIELLQDIPKLGLIGASFSVSFSLSKVIHSVLIDCVHSQALEFPSHPDELGMI